MELISEREVRELLATGTFDADWYARTYNDVAKSGMSPAEHYLWLGRRLGRKTSSGDAAAAPADNPPLMPQESSSPSIRSGPVAMESPFADSVHSATFDARSYLACHSDLASYSIEDAINHWQNHGRHEGRIGSGTSRFSERRPRKPGTLPDKPRIAYFAPVSAKSGLGTAARGYASALALIGCDFEVIDTTAALYMVPGANVKSPKVKPDIVILSQNADSLGNLFRFVDQSILDDAYVIGLCVWELMAFNPQWRDIYAAFDEIWLPSQFCAEAVATCAPAQMRINVVPHVLAQPAWQENATRRQFGIPEEAFTFLYTFDVSSAIDRKNPIAVLEAFREAFGNDPTKFLVVKYHSSKSFHERVRQMRAIHSASNVLFLDLLLSEEQNAALKQIVDCLVSPHRAEGFGLNIAEMMALGKPVIATAYSGNMEFCKDSNCILIPAKLTEVVEGTLHYPPGAIWAEPDHDALVEAMKAVSSDGADIRKIAANGATFVRTVLSSAAIAKTIDTLLGEIIRDQDDILGRLNANWEERRKMTWRHPASFTDHFTGSGNWPTISVIVPVYNIASELLRACVDSVRNQSYPFWELCLCDDASTNPETIALLDELRGTDQRIKIRRLSQNGGISVATNAAVEMATGSYIAFLDNDDTIEPRALMSYARAIAENPDCEMLYCDEDKIDPEGRHVEPYFKPDWSPEHLESCMYVLHMLAVRKSTFLDLGGYRPEYTGAQDYDLALRIARSGGQIVHIPELLYHWRIIPGSAAAQVDAKPQALINAKCALSDYAEARFGPDARVEDGMLPGLFRITRGAMVRPPVTLVMTTNNTTKEVSERGIINLPTHFLKSIVDLTDYDNFRVLMASNGVLADECRDLLASIDGREIIYRGDNVQFNFADKANFAMLSADTELIVLLNDDMEVRNAGWLSALVDQIVKEDVGAVGAHLSYPSGRVQHVGMVMGVNETTAHVYHGHPGDVVGYNGYAAIIRNYSAVTGACMATRRSLYELVGGFDTAFATDFNDTDYCLKLGRMGYRTVYTPFAQLYHFESQTSVRSGQKPEEKALFLSRWREIIEKDPYFNPNLRRDSITFEATPEAWPH